MTKFCDIFIHICRSARLIIKNNEIKPERRMMMLISLIFRAVIFSVSGFIPKLSGLYAEKLMIQISN